MEPRTALDVLIIFLDDIIAQECIPFDGEPLPPMDEEMGPEWSHYCVEF